MRKTRMGWVEKQGPFSQMALLLLLLGLLYFRDVPTIQEVNIVTAVQMTIMISPKQRR